jgi:hypothetical protein
MTPDPDALELVRPQHREEGRIAYNTGKKIMENPYPLGSIECNRWRLGWFNARRAADMLEE